MDLTGITRNKKYPNKYIAQYYDTTTRWVKHIGIYDNVEDAVSARDEFVENLKKYNGKVIPNIKKLPKGIQKLKNKDKLSYRTLVQFWHGKYKDKKATIHLGTYSTIEEAVQARLEFIENLK